MAPSPKVVLQVAACYVAILLVAGAAVFAAGIYFWWSSVSCDDAGECDRIAFDSTSWRSGGTLQEPVRIRMVDDLLKRYQLVGMSRQEIDNLLGTARDRDWFPECEYLYWLGPERGLFSVDSEWLCIEIREEGVTRAEIVTD